jgi:hypothetical protein
LDRFDIDGDTEAYLSDIGDEKRKSRWEKFKLWLNVKVVGKSKEEELKDQQLEVLQ